jgi:intracellular sulfur oxidation DsrE/DsrF family protein
LELLTHSTGTLIMKISITTQLFKLTLLFIPLLWLTVSYAEENIPWGRATAEKINYSPQKVLYDVSAANIDSFTHVLDRVSYLNNVYNANPFDASIVVVLHGDEIPFFAVDNYGKYKDLMERARSLTLAGPIEFRMCRIAAEGHGFKPEDIHGFVKVVPMADAEIVRLQQEEGYAYMR